jgi:hypothetical protein
MKEHENKRTLKKLVNRFLQELNDYGTEKRGSYASVACLLTV